MKAEQISIVQVVEWVHNPWVYLLCRTEFKLKRASLMTNQHLVQGLNRFTKTDSVRGSARLSKISLNLLRAYTQFLSKLNGTKEIDPAIYRLGGLCTPPKPV